jgi:hypothetical protein
MERPPVQLDAMRFRLLTAEEFDSLPFAAKLEYLRTAIQVRKVINSQLEQMLFELPGQPQS